MMATAKPNLLAEARVECDHCGFRQIVKVTMSAKLKVGDQLYDDPNNANFKRCKKCKRIKLTVVEVQASSLPNKPRGFWRTPGTETGSSSPTSEGEE